MGPELLGICGLDDQLTEAVVARGAVVHLDVVLVEDVGDLPEDHDVICVLSGCRSEIGQSLCREVRLSSRFSDLPLIAVVEQPWSREVQEAFALGVDDYLPVFQLDQLKTKLLTLRAEGASSGTYLSGKVVLADPDRHRRVHLGRNLRNTGLEVSFAINERIPDDPGVKLIVAHCDLPPAGAIAALRSFRSGPGHNVPWIITGTRDVIDTVRANLPVETNLIFFDLDADPTQIISAANKLLLGHTRSMRRSARIDHETPVKITLQEEAVEIWGYSYNINLGGLYVRTLTPPALGTAINVRFTPPSGRGWFVIDGKVVWRQEYSGGRGYPPGCGVQFEEIPVADGAALTAGYHRLLEEQKPEQEGARRYPGTP